MPRVIVVADDSERILFEEAVNVTILSERRYSEQFIERLGWAIEEDQDRLEMLGPRSTLAWAPRRQTCIA